MSVYDFATVFALGFLFAALGAIGWVGWYVARAARPRRRRSAT